MSIVDFQRALCDMTLDPVLAAAVRRDDADGLAGYTLTPGEHARLQAVVRQPGMSLTCSLARANRFAPIADAFPLTCSLLKPVLRMLLDDLWRVQRPGNYQLSGEVDAFARHIERKLAAGEIDQPYAADVFRYERAVWSLIQPLVAAGRTGSVHGGAPDRIVTVVFMHDPGALLPPLERDELPPPGIPHGRYLAELRLREDALEMHVTSPSP